MQLAQQAAGLLFIAAQQVGGGLCISDLEGGLVVQQQVGPILAGAFWHPQGSPAAGVLAILQLDPDVVHGGHIALPPLPPGLDAAIVGGIQMQAFRIVQVGDKGSNVHREVNLL